ncbi:MAG: DUF732 domain-containing protein [Mycobacterium sp.]
MKKLLLPRVFAAVVAAFAVGLAAAGTASADEGSYFVDLTNANIDGSADFALQLGYAVCDDLENGVPRQTTLDALYENTGEDISYDDANVIYKAAIANLC